MAVFHPLSSIEARMTPRVERLGLTTVVILPKVSRTPSCCKVIKNKELGSETSLRDCHRGQPELNLFSVGRNPRLRRTSQCRMVQVPKTTVCATTSATRLILSLGAQATLGGHPVVLTTPRSLDLWTISRDADQTRCPTIARHRLGLSL